MLVFASILIRYAQTHAFGVILGLEQVDRKVSLLTPEGSYSSQTMMKFKRENHLLLLWEGHLEYGIDQL